MNSEVDMNITKSELKDFATNDTVIGVDLGGTNIRAALVRGGTVLKHYACNVPTNEGIGAVLEAIVDSIERVRVAEAKSIGVGVPGLVDQKRGVVYDIHNIAAWGKVPLRDMLEQRFGLPVRIDNDANCFVLSELYYGHARNCRNVIGLALGTGMGAGIVSNGRLHSGRDCGAGELGMIDYLDRDFEAYCSGAFFEEHYGLSGEKLYERALKGDGEALNAFAELGTHIGEAIRMISYAFAPDMVVIGGSVAQSNALFAEAMRESMQRNLKIGHLPQVRFSNNTQSAVLGAAALYFDTIRS